MKDVIMDYPFKTDILNHSTSPNKIDFTSFSGSLDEANEWANIGVCYYDDKEGYVRLPDCVFDGLNYSEYFDTKTNTLNIKDVPMVNLRIDRVLNSELAKKYNIECGEIRPMLDWILGK